MLQDNDFKSLNITIFLNFNSIRDPTEIGSSKQACAYEALFFFCYCVEFECVTYSNDLLNLDFASNFREHICNATTTITTAAAASAKQTTASQNHTRIHKPFKWMSIGRNAYRPFCAHIVCIASVCANEKKKYIHHARHIVERLWEKKIHQQHTIAMRVKKKKKMIHVDGD